MRAFQSCKTFYLIWQILFILVNSDEPKNKRIFEYFRISTVNVPSVQILNLSSDARYKMPTDDITFENLKKFCQNFLSKTAKVSFLLDKLCQEPQNLLMIFLVSLIYNKRQNKGHPQVQHGKSLHLLPSFTEAHSFF